MIHSSSGSNGLHPRMLAVLMLLSAGWGPCTPSAVPPTPTPPPGAVSVQIRFKDVDGLERQDQTSISVAPVGGACEFRLELDDPANHPPNAIHQIGGSPLEEFTLPCDAAPPAFVETAGNLPAFEQQTAYYWSVLARDYARRRLWLPSTTTPPSTTRVDISVTSQQEMPTSCLPLVPGETGCMRAWPGEGPRIYLLEHEVDPFLVVHEFGHYAAGYVFGQMDALLVNSGFDPSQCSHRGFQETIAETFKLLFFHDRGQPSVIDLSGTATWMEACAPDEHQTGAAFMQAFAQALYNVPWSSHDRANEVMADALRFALTLHQGINLGALANGVVQRVTDTEPAVAAAVKAIFNAHRMAIDVEHDCDVVDNVPKNGQCFACLDNGAGMNCALGRCDTVATDHHRCIPPDGTGGMGTYCTNDHQCAAGRRCQVGSNLAGRCT